MSFQIIRNDITRVKADAIVNTANPKPVVGGGTDFAIYTAAGMEQLLAERAKIGDIARGQAVVTSAYDLKAKYIIHTVGPIWEGGNKGEFDILKSCYENSLQLALNLKCRSIAFPLIATGVYGFPKDKALQIAMSVIQPFVMEHSMKVILVVFDKRAFELSGNVVDNIREFVDANYVEKTGIEEYAFDSVASNRPRRNDPKDAERELVRRRHYTNMPDGGVCLEKFSPEPPTMDTGGVLTSKPTGTSCGEKVDIRKMLDASEKTFQERLFEIIDERGLTGPQVYRNYISKQVFSKIQADKDYHPNKYTAIAMCLSLHLSVDETQDLIGRAGWRLSPSSKADLVVTGCIMNKEYNIAKIDCILFDYDCPELAKIK